ncbi:MAG: penicillin-binding protein activator [Cycloclasticus sp.]|nr:penicillin-binding protein activator [Cycloclasticus sp.]MBQ0790741.1 penicillin-binding protein activator [Cycloclasticus sp.]
MNYFKHSLSATLKLGLIVIIAFSLLNCASTQTTPKALTAQSNPLLDQAQAALSQQQFTLAAQLFVQLANVSTGSQKGEFLISAINAYTQAGQIETAIALTHTLVDLADKLNTEQQFMLAQLLLQQGKTELTIELLTRLDEPQLNNEQRIRLHTLSSDTFFQAGNLIESARERVILDALIHQPSDKLTNQSRLLDTLSLLSEQALSFMRPSADSNLSGWIDLATTLKQHNTVDLTSPEILSWQTQYPSHTANSAFLSTLAERSLKDFITPQKVGVFLPLNGPFSSAAHSIRQGIIAAAYSMASRWQPDITFYDTSTDSIDLLYTQAISDGMNVIIGPLDKSKAAEIASLAERSIPVISLNKSELTDQTNYYEFSLAPEEDVTQVLSLAWLKGLEKALILSPQSSYGERLASHFSHTWQQLGGEIVGLQTYDPEQVDYSTAIKNLLQLDESHNRFSQLRRRLNLNLHFEERRRQDADFIFLLASPREGRLIKPQLRFHRAADLAVFSTSNLYEGETNTVLNRDLDGISFCAMPWLMEPENYQEANLDKASKRWPKAHGSHVRLMAFGYDAYQLTPHLDRLHGNTFSRFKGKTGLLSIPRSGLVNRQLSCGYFNRGKIKSTGLAPHLQRASQLSAPIKPIEKATSNNTQALQ